MRVFTLWNQKNIPAANQECIDALKKVYPQLEIIRFRSPVGEDPRLESDLERLRVLINTEGDCLYFDADCLPGEELIIPLDKVSVLHCPDGSLDNSVICKPKGQEGVLQQLLIEAPDTFTGQEIRSFIPDKFFPSLNGRLRNQFLAIAGHPDNRFVKHLAYTGSSFK